MRDLTLDQLSEYLRCSTYFKEHIENPKDHQLNDRRQPTEILMFTLVKWMINYLLQRGFLPSEEELVYAIALSQGRLIYHGYEFLFMSEINDIQLNLLQFRQFLYDLKDIEYALSIKRFIHNGISVIVPLLIVTKDTQYFWSSLPYRHFLNDSSFLIPNMIEPRSKKVLIQWHRNRIELKSIKETISISKSRDFYESVLTGISNKIYIPIQNCTHMQCSHYKQCYTAKE